MATTGETTRTFIGIPIPDPLNGKLAALQRTLSPQVVGCRWTSNLPFHATLAFLGDVRDRDLNAIGEAVAASARMFESFELDLGGLGAFPSARRPRVLWAGLTAPNLEPLLGLREAIVRGALEAGYRVDDQQFHPHVTLGRIKPARSSAGDLTALLERHGGRPADRFTVLEVVTFASTLGPGGPSHRAFSRAPLAPKKTGASP